MSSPGVRATARDAKDRPEEALASPPVVLVVDDDQDTRVAISEVLEDAGYSVIAVSDGQRAHDYLIENPPPACIILDLWMPVMDGWTLASKVIQGQVPSAPIVVVTAAGAHYGYPVPPSLVLRKPIDPGRLIRIVQSVATTPPH